MSGAAMDGQPLCNSLELLKIELNELKVDTRLLKRMQKWECLTMRDVKHLSTIPEAERLDGMMQCLENRGPSKWPFLVCVLLEISCDDMAKSTWRTIMGHVQDLDIQGKQTEAMDVWGSFIRRMSDVLVLDQQPGKKDQGKWEKPLQNRQRKTASEIWKAIVKEPLQQSYRSANGLSMWKILVNTVANMMSTSDLKTNNDLWEELVGSVLDQLEKGEREDSLLMFEYLVEKAKRVPSFQESSQESSLKKSNSEVDCRWEVLVDFMLKVQDSDQSSFVYVVKDVLMKLLRNLFENDDMPSAKNLLDHLKNSISTLMEKDARQTAKTVWFALINLGEGLREDSQRYKILNDCLFGVLHKLNKTTRADRSSDLEEMRANLSNGALSMKAYQCSQGGMEYDVVSRLPCRKIDEVGDASSTGRASSVESDVQLISFYSMTSQSSGLALVINNIEFDDDITDRRDGSEMDELSLPFLLRRLGFHVLQEINLSKHDLHRTIADFANRPDHTDAAVLAIMTHGNNEGIAGSDGKLLSLQTVIDCFSSENAPNLVGKPKWLSLQACRTVRQALRCNKPFLPTADLFITFTTLPGDGAMRCTLKGTVYVQALKDVLDLPQAHTLSLFELHMKVQETMSVIWTKEMANDGNEYKQKEQKLEIHTLGWTKKFRFKSIHDSLGVVSELDAENK